MMLAALQWMAILSAVVAGGGDHYRSRFHPEYMLESPRRFWDQYHQEDSPGTVKTAEEKLVWGLKWLDMDLPYTLEGTLYSYSRQQLQEALRVRSDPKLLEVIWGDEAASQLIMHNDRWARKLRKALFHNVMGQEEELEKMTPDSATGYQEPAWEPILEAAHGRLAFAYQHGSWNSSLFAQLHRTGSLTSLLKLLQSPDAREQQSVSTIVSGILKRAIDNARDGPAEERAISRRLVKRLGRLLPRALEGISENPSKARLRSLAPLLQLHLVGVRDIPPALSLDTLRDTLSFSLISRVAGPIYAAAHSTVDQFVTLLVALMRERSSQDWDFASSLLIDNTLPWAHASAADPANGAETGLPTRPCDDKLRLSLLVDMFIHGQISPDHSTPLIIRLIQYAATHHCLLTRLMVLGSLDSSEFLEALVPHGTLTDADMGNVKTLFELVARWAAGELARAREETEDREAGKMVLDMLISILQSLFLVVPQMTEIVRNDIQCYRLYVLLSQDDSRAILRNYM